MLYFSNQFIYTLCFLEGPLQAVIRITRKSFHWDPRGISITRKSFYWDPQGISITRKSFQWNPQGKRNRERHLKHMFKRFRNS